MESVKVAIREKFEVLTLSKDILQGNQAETQDILLEIHSSLVELKEGVAAKKEEINTIQNQIRAAARLSQLLKNYDVRLKECKTALPAGVPKKLGQEATKENEGKPGSKETEKSLKLNHVNYLTLAEFESIPKYMKGRVQYDTLKTAVDDLNSAMETKYTFLARTFANMSSLSEKKRYKLFRSQESKATTKGVHFVTADDLKDCSVLRSETNRRTLLTILRHLKKTREIRGPGSIVRYAAA